jgi:hypothetical protein
MTLSGACLYSYIGFRSIKWSHVTESRDGCSSCEQASRIHVWWDKGMSRSRSQFTASHFLAQCYLPLAWVTLRLIHGIKSYVVRSREIHDSFGLCSSVAGSFHATFHISREINSMAGRSGCLHDASCSFPTCWADTLMLVSVASFILLFASWHII